jgi:putative flippase GtrA
MFAAMGVAVKVNGKKMISGREVDLGDCDKAWRANQLRSFAEKCAGFDSDKSKKGEELDSSGEVSASGRANLAATLIRWGKFNFVGGIGIAVQFVALFFLKSGLHVPTLLATAIAVEIAVLHNFAWHERFTWRDREFGGGWWRRMARFHLGNGVVSIAGNVALMRVLAGPLNYLVANAIAIGLCSIANFAVSEWWVFEE